MLWRGVAVALVVAAGGCSEKVPGHASNFPDGAFYEPPPPDAGDGVDADVDAGPGPDGGLAAWTGTWKYTSGAQGFACGGSLSVVEVTGTLEITASSSGKTLTVKEDGCVFVFDVAGFVATSEAGQSCAAWAVPTIPLWTLTVQDDGTLHEMLGGRVYVSGEVCTISGSAKLVRE